MDPEQIYQEVLQEEQGKGSAPQVAEGRAKAARQRAAEGSPHPKEPKWWPGSQPHFEGGEAAEEAPAEEAVEEAPAEEPAAEEPAEAPAEAPAAEAPAPETPAPAPEPAPAAAEAAPAAPAAAQAPAAAAVAAPPVGVRHGTPTGNRLRPEDGVSTEAQFAGQQAMYDRRKLIDELVATGVPAISAEDTDRRSPFLALLYILIPLLAVVVVANQNDTGASAGGEAHGEAEPGGGGEGENGGDSGGGGDADASVSAANISFDTDRIEVPAATEVSIFFDNTDNNADHNISVFQDSQSALAFVGNDDDSGLIYEGEIIPPGQSTTYTFESPEAGEYYFHCDVHPNMSGAFVTQ